MLYLFLAQCIAGVDLLLKSAIWRIPKEEFPRIVKGTRGSITLHREKNEGLPYGIFSRKAFATVLLPSVMLGISLVQLIGAVFFKKSAKSNTMEKLGLSFVVGGGISNVTERLRKGYVVDYFSITVPGLKKLQNTIFNIGDIFIILGSFLIFLQAISKEDR